MGEILMRAGIAERMYEAMRQWLSWLPGGLMNANIGFCAVFSASSGSAVATAATIGTVAIPEMKRHGYNERLFLGTLAAGGTLDILIPPSINLIVYGALTETSIPQLYLAGFLPGFICAFLMILTVIAACLWRPRMGRAAEPDRLADAACASLPDLIPAAADLPRGHRIDLCRLRHRDRSGGARAGVFLHARRHPQAADDRA